MLFLSETEKQDWRQFGREIFDGRLEPEAQAKFNIGAGRTAMFRFYAGCLFAAAGLAELAKRWFAAGALEEKSDIMTNAFVAAFLERHNNRFEKPDVIFRDPAPYIHFGRTLAIRLSREKAVKFSANSLPRFKTPPAYMDIGCGDGSFSRALLEGWREAGCFDEIREILLVDSSAAMLEKAEAGLAEAFPHTPIKMLRGRIQDVCGQITRRYEITVSSLAIHHMPRKDKIACLKTLGPALKHFLLFELDANNDLPELGSPELAVSVYQSYGRIISMVFENDTSVETAQNCVDCFLMAELVSLMSERRGRRNDYHMLRGQWKDVFDEALGADFELLAETGVFLDEYLELFMLHYAAK